MLWLSLTRAGVEIYQQLPANQQNEITLFKQKEEREQDTERVGV